ncbi:hypothetical protein QN372_11180 [Undibacterium sp. RTI2.1]|uniref:hypothetical protein n=1 Tax=unclassified Undibacterium TaxID=2630295 RepID=UPI002AB3EB93|nr:MULTISPECIES: hypothetical protein [unclassified Undibacterium]MDY7537187.1 hypothetical protein [Undibacterium sp. 5I1]MEB0031312.1 hypothetical protein [Undibacterium sp. RTI2.1]MEB0117681.1 hypothetical protein [Undibacterium sp. RTI2.2]MEB0231476.1 hypothetical protein [Undibacterium sp. 10I3]MEB0258983.1 hypothetical protein [Undibacterium sp. 5I1]
MTSPKILDCKNQIVTVGDIVRIVSLDKQFIKSFPADERILFESMIGNFFKIVDLDDFGQACVVREWHDETGMLQTHVIALDAEEMEKV